VRLVRLVKNGCGHDGGLLCYSHSQLRANAGKTVCAKRHLLGKKGKCLNFILEASRSFCHVAPPKTFFFPSYLSR
jgi:hypothetical protein